MEFVCKPNMALHLNREIRPNVVLEEHVYALGKNVLESKLRERRARVEEKSRFWWEIIPISGFHVMKEEEGS